MNLGSRSQRRYAFAEKVRLSQVAALPTVLVEWSIYRQLEILSSSASDVTNDEFVYSVGTDVRCYYHIRASEREILVERRLHRTLVCLQNALGHPGIPTSDDHQGCCKQLSHWGKGECGITGFAS